MPARRPLPRHWWCFAVALVLFLAATLVGGGWATFGAHDGALFPLGVAFIALGLLLP